MKSWVPKKKIVRLAIGIAVFGLLLYLSALFIIFREIKKIENFYRDTESQSSKEERFWAIKSTLETNKELVQILQDFFIQQGEEVKFIEQIEEIAKTSGVDFEIVSIDVKSGQANAIKEDVSVKMKIKGPWGSVISFVDHVEKMPVGASIENLNLDAEVPGSWFGDIDFIIFKGK